MLQLKDGTAATTAKGIQGVSDEFNLWGSVFMLIADMTSINTAKKTRVVIRLQQIFKKNGSPRPKFISCQHHVLDCILCLVVDNKLHGSTKSPDIDYFFVKNLTSKYDHLKEAFSNGKAKIMEIGSWRDNIKFLYHLTRDFHHFTEKDKALL